MSLSFLDGQGVEEGGEGVDQSSSSLVSIGSLSLGGFFLPGLIGSTIL
jgi:hypothetical protein